MKKYFLVLIILLSLGAPVAALAQTATPATTPSNCSGSFCTLTQIPAIQTIATSNTVNVFFNNLYKYCVGIAAALAVLMIMYAGFTWMTAGDNTEKISQAKKRIADAVLGLVLVLSPAIVFGIINPNVLSLNIGLSSLAPSPATPTATALTIPSGSGITSTNTSGDTSAACTAQGGTAQLYCSNAQSGGTFSVGPNNTCAAGYTLQTACATKAGSTPDICSSYTSVEFGPPATNDSCTAGKAIDVSCCASVGGVSGTGSVCCGIPK